MEDMKSEEYIVYISVGGRINMSANYDHREGEYTNLKAGNDHVLIRDANLQMLTSALPQGFDGVEGDVEVRYRITALSEFQHPVVTLLVTEGYLLAKDPKTGVERPLDTDMRISPSPVGGYFIYSERERLSHQAQQAAVERRMEAAHLQAEKDAQVLAAYNATHPADEDLPANVKPFKARGTATRN